MLTVRELIKALEKQDPDALIFVFAHNEDSPIDSADQVKPVTVRSKYQVNEYYCQGDSEVPWYAARHPDAKFVAIIGNPI